MEAEQESESEKSILMIIIGIITFIGIYLAGIYISLRISFYKMKENEMIESRLYPCYLNIILSTTLIIDNIVRYISIEGNESFSCKFQAFILAVFDKLILTSITVNSYLTYLGLSNNEYYMANIRSLFIKTNLISILSSLIIGLFFLFGGTQMYNNVCYVKATDVKEKSDSVITIILFIIALYSNLKSILLLLRNIKELSLNENNNISGYLVHFYRMLFSIYLSSIMFLVSLLIINDCLFVSDFHIDLCFVVLCLIIDLFYTMNSTVINQTLILFGCKKPITYDDFDVSIDDRNNTQMSLDFIED